MNSKTQIRIFTIIGVLLVIVGFTLKLDWLSFLNHDQTDSTSTNTLENSQVDDGFLLLRDIYRTVENNIDGKYKSEGYEVKIVPDDEYYEVYITLNDEENRFEYSSYCGGVATGFLEILKRDHADINNKVSAYHFEFLKTHYIAVGSSGSDYSSTAFSATYLNKQNESVPSPIKLSLKAGNTSTEYDAKTFLQYLKEWSTHDYTLIENINLHGDHFTATIFEDNSFEIKPKDSADSERNPDSTLKRYLEEYASQFFTLSAVRSNITTDNTQSQIEISFTYTNHIDLYPIIPKVVFYIYNAQDELIDVITTKTLEFEMNEPNDYDFEVIYTDDTPAYFEIAYVDCVLEKSEEESQHIYVVFE